MKHTNPFPGMNPWLETRWPGVHLRLIALMLEALGSELPDDLVADGEVRVDVEAAGKGYRPDIAIIEPGEEWKHGLPPRWQPETNGGGVMTATQPLIIEMTEERERWIEIRTEGGELVTVIELLSPANKGAGQDAYVEKRNDLISGRVNVVEIDLLRAGKRSVNLHREFWTHPDRRGAESTVVCVTRAALRTRREVYFTPLRERLPAIRVPLRVTDRDVVLDVQALIDRCYSTGRYWMLNHRQPLHPPLPETDLAWAGERLHEAGFEN